MRTLYVTDLDGTLLRNDVMISEESVKILNRLIDGGVLVTYATARSFHSAYSITKDIRFKLPVITRNGTTFADQLGAKETETAFFTKEAINELKSLLPVIDRCGYTSVYVDGKMYKLYREGPKNKEFAEYIKYSNSVGDWRYRPTPSEDTQFAGDVSYITLIGSREELLSYFNKVKDSDKWETIFQKDTYLDEFWLEICPKDATKAKAVLKLKERFECDRIVVFGDSLNDLPMFEIADEAIGVANAMPEVLKAATRVIGSNEEDAVAKYIELQETGSGKL